MNHIFELLESQGYRQGGPIRYFDEGGEANDFAGMDAGLGEAMGASAAANSAPSSTSGSVSVDAVVGKPGEEAQATAAALGNSKGKSAADFANALAEMMPGLDPLDAMMVGLGNITKGAQTETNSSGIMGSFNDTTGMLSTNGLTASQLAGLVDLGYANYGINNPDINQTPGMMLNSMHTAATLNSLAPLAQGLIPGLGLAKGMAGLINAIQNDDTDGIMSAIGNFGLQAVAKGIGVPAGVLGALVEGNFGKAAGNAVTGAVMSGFGKSLGLPGSVVGALGNVSGATNAIGRGVSNAVNDVTGGVANTGTGISLSNPFSSGNVTNADNRGSNNLNREGGGGDSASTPASSTPSVSSPVSSAAYSGSSVIPVSNSSNAADIGYYYDIAGNDIFAPKKTGTDRPDIIKYMQSNVATAAQGGSIEDLLNYVRK